MQKTSLLAGATRKAPAKEMSVYSTLPKFETLAKCVPLKVTHRRIRKETEKFGRGEEGFLMKKGCKEGGVSL